MKAVLFVSHGSRIKATCVEITRQALRLKAKSGVPIWENAFLELNEPSIPAGIDSCISQGATEIIVLLNFLHAGSHVLKDIPKLLEDKKFKYPHVRFHMTAHLGSHPKLEKIFLSEIKKTISHK